MSKNHSVIDPYKPLPGKLLDSASTSVNNSDKQTTDIRKLFESKLPDGDKKEVDSEFKKTFVLTYQKPKKKSKQPRKSKKSLTSQEKRALGLHRLPRKGLKYEPFLSLNSLWSGYMTELLDLESLEKGGWSPNLNEETRQLQLQMRVCRAELTGALVTVASAHCPGHVGLTGLVVMETKNTLQIIGEDNKLRLIPKTGSSFSFQHGGYKFTVPGSSIDSKPAERITKKLKNKYPCNF